MSLINKIRNRLNPPQKLSNNQFFIHKTENGLIMATYCAETIEEEMKNFI